MINPEMYHKARKHKIAQMKSMLREMIADDDDDPMDKDKLSGIMEEAGESPEEEEIEVKSGEEIPGHEEEEMSPLHKKMSAYFKPKAKERRPGTAIMFAKSKEFCAPAGKMGKK